MTKTKTMDARQIVTIEFNITARRAMAFMEQAMWVAPFGY